jgi:putative endonuclease
MSWVIYILELSDKSFYTGITNDLIKRLKVHRSGKGSKYVKSRLPFRVVYVELAADRSEASKREAEIKKMSKSRKNQLLITKYGGVLHLCEKCCIPIVSCGCTVI